MYFIEVGMSGQYNLNKKFTIAVDIVSILFPITFFYFLQ